MRLIEISKETLINPEYVSHIAVRTEKAPENGGQYAHDYPVYRITMYDGHWYDIAFKNHYPNENFTWEPISYLVKEMTWPSK